MAAKSSVRTYVISSAGLSVHSIQDVTQFQVLTSRRPLKRI